MPGMVLIVPTSGYRTRTGSFVALKSLTCPLAPMTRQLAQEWRRAVFVAAIDLAEHGDDAYHLIQPNQSGPFQRAVRVVRAELHRRVDVLCAGNPFSEDEGRLVDQVGDDARQHPTSGYSLHLRSSL